MFLPLAALALLAAAPRPAARYDIRYTFRSAEPATHFGDVTVTVGRRDRDLVQFQLPAWYPGRYAIYNFAANVQEVWAKCGDATVPAPKTDKTTWLVQCIRTKPITFGYRVWWNDLNGSFSQIDSTHINLNPGNSFVYVVGRKSDPVTVTYAGPDGWRIINGQPGEGPMYRFPNYDIFIDNPTEISNAFTVDSFIVGQVTYRVMLHTDKDPGDFRLRLVHDIQRIVTAEAALWGDPPIPQYTFLVHFLQGNGGDGMEHTSSTQISLPVSLASLTDTSQYLNALGVFGHEFFHTWNMKRLRARELGPWDYTRETPTRTLWIGEGVTNYYGVRMMLRSGVWDTARYVKRVAQAVTQLQSSPGRLLMTAEQSSEAAWFFDAVPLRQKTNLRNTTISYYNKGELLGWLLDLDIRARTHGQKSLDDVMRLMWKRFWLGKSDSYYLQGHGYSDADFLQAVNDVSGSNHAEFFRRYVSGLDELPYDSVLAGVGLKLTASDGKYSLSLDPAAPGADLGRAWLLGH
ncbi:MAG: M61 family metallopeptidase [Gemmatimonadales bacterium]